MASKFDQFLKASWNAIFSAQEAPRRASAADRRRRWSRPEATGGGFRRGKQEPPRRRIQKEDGRKDWQNPWVWSNTPTRDGRRIEAPLGGVPPPILRSLECCDLKGSMEERSCDVGGFRGSLYGFDLGFLSWASSRILSAGWLKT